MRRQSPSRLKRLVVAALLVVSLGVSFSPVPAHASAASIAGWAFPSLAPGIAIGEAVARYLGPSNNKSAAPTKSQAFKALSIKQSALSEGDFLQYDGQKTSFQPWVNNLWKLMRQISNIMVMLFLFISSVATTLNLQIGTYGIKRMLPSIIIATILANFSMLFAKILIYFEIIIRIALVRMSGAANVSDIFSNLTQPFRGLINIMQISSAMTALVVAAASGCFLFIALLILAVVILLVWVRSYVLAILVVLAPVAFLAMGAPFTQGLFRKWWSEYTKWLMLPSIQLGILALGSILVSKTVTPDAFTMIPFIIAVVTLYFAIRAPFMVGGTVTAISGFLANNQVTRAAGQNAEIVAHRTPLGAALRYFPQSAARRQQVLSDLRKKPLFDAVNLKKKGQDEGYVKRNRQDAARAMLEARKAGKSVAEVYAARDAVLNEKEAVKARQRLAMPGDSAYKGFLGIRSAIARSQAAADIRAGQVSVNAQNQINANRADAIQTDRRLADQLADSEFLKEFSEAELEKSKLKANDDYRQSHRSLGLALAMSQERAAGLKDKLEGLAASMKAVALGSDKEVAALRRQGVLMKELGSAAYAKTLADMKYELRKSGKNEITTALESNEQNKKMVEELLGPGFGQPGSIMKKALISLVGGKKSLESAVESAEKSEMLAFTNNQMAGIGAIYDGLSPQKQAVAERIKTAWSDENTAEFELATQEEEDLKSLWDHSYSEDQKGEFVDKWHKAFDRMSSDRQQNILDFLGIAHLDQEEQDQKIFELLSKDEANLRKVSVVGGMKALGDYESGRQSFIRDSSRVVVEGNYAAGAGKVEKVMQILAAGSIHTDQGMRMINQLHVASGKEGETAMDTWQSHLGAMATARAVDKWVVDPSRSEADVLKSLDHTDSSSIASITNKHIDAYNATAAPGQQKQRINDEFIIQGLKVKGSNQPATLAQVKKVLQGDPQAEELVDGNNNSLKAQDVMRALRTSLSSNIEPVHRTGQSIVGDVGQPETA